MIYIEENIYYKLRLDLVLTSSPTSEGFPPSINSNISHLKCSQEGQRPTQINNSNYVTNILITTRWAMKVPIINFLHLSTEFWTLASRVFRINKLHDYSTFRCLPNNTNTIKYGIILSITYRETLLIVYKYF